MKRSFLPRDLLTLSQATSPRPHLGALQLPGGLQQPLPPGYPASPSPCLSSPLLPPAFAHSALPEPSPQPRTARTLSTAPRVLRHSNFSATILPAPPAGRPPSCLAQLCHPHCTHRRTHAEYVNWQPQHRPCSHYRHHTQDSASWAIEPALLERDQHQPLLDLLG